MVSVYSQILLNTAHEAYFVHFDLALSKIGDRAGLRLGCGSATNLAAVQILSLRLSDLSSQTSLCCFYWGFFMQSMDRITQFIIK